MAASVGMPLRSPIVAAPHRLLFAVGALNLLLSMSWWAGWMLQLRWGMQVVPQGGLYGGSIHALVMPYLVLGPFFFGFLFTVFPRWMAVDGFTRWHYLPTAGCLLLAQGLLLASPWIGTQGLVMAALVGLAGWGNGVIQLADRLRQDRSACLHARTLTLAMSLGLFGWLCFVLHVWTGEVRWLQVATRVGTHGLLLPVYLSVAHRMFPFFAQCVEPGRAMWRPAAWLWWAVAASLAHLALDLAGLRAWLWLADFQLLALGVVWSWRTWPSAVSPLVLRALFIAMLWLPLGAALSGLQSLGALAGWEAGGARAPLHAYTIGLFGGLLVAMVTRVSRGHSGRAITMNGIDRFAFFAIQAVALLRIAAEWSSDPWAVNALAGLLWIVVLLPWLVQHLGYWTTVRVDGKPG